MLCANHIRFVYLFTHCAVCLIYQQVRGKWMLRISIIKNGISTYPIWYCASLAYSASFPFKYTGNLINDPYVFDVFAIDVFSEICCCLFSIKTTESKFPIFGLKRPALRRKVKQVQPFLFMKKKTDFYVFNKSCLLHMSTKTSLVGYCRYVVDAAVSYRARKSNCTIDKVFFLNSNNQR